MGGSAKQPTSQTVTQTSIPKEFYPYLQDALGKGQAITNRPYEPYPGARLSDFSTDTKQAYDMNRENVGSWMPFMQQGTSAVGAGINQTQSAINSIPTSGGLQQFQAGNARDVNTGQWNSQSAQQYMSPYINSVMDNLARRENQSFLMDRAQGGQRAQAAGAYGGGRHAVMEQMSRDQHNQRLNELQANSLNSAYTTGLGAYGADQGRALAAQQANQGADLTTNKMNLDAKLSVQDLGARMDMQGASLGMQGGAQLAAQGGQMAGLGQQYAANQATDADRLRAQGLEQEQVNQAGLDLGYQNFTDQRDWDKNNLAFQAGLIHGLPLGNNTTMSTSQYSNPFAQIAGAGIGLAGAYNSFKGP